MKVLIAPDSFKGSLTSVQVARAVAEGWARVRPGDEIVLCPLADGGEGTLEAVAAAGGWAWQEAEVRDPIRRPIRARWLRSDDGTTAVVEMAEASGLSRLAPDELDAVGATSIEALGAGMTGATVDLDGLDPRLAEVSLEVACDVTNPLLGERGAAATYGPQKGATTPQIVELLDRRNAAWADALEAAAGREARTIPGAGAAGGVGFAMLAIAGRFGRFALRPGVELVMETVGFAARLAASDLVITGEGRIDAQTAFGKTALGVARGARAAGVRCAAVGGGVEPAGVEALGRLGVTVVPVWERAIAVADAMAAGAAPLVDCGARMAAMQELVAPTIRTS
jgi:glycerate kinase